MNFEKTISVVDSHTAGEPFRLVTSGIPSIKGKTMADKLNYFKDNFDDLRCGLMHEPRGHADMFGGILTEPVTDKAHFGLIFMEGAGYLNMCGHGTIAAITIILETGLLKMQAPTTEVILDTPAGLVKCMAQCENGRVIDVAIENVPSFLYKEKLPVVVEDKTYKVDVSFGGSFFGLICEDELDFPISVENLPKLKELADKLEVAINEQHSFQHPEHNHINTVDLIEFYNKEKCDKYDSKNVVIFGGAIDRSPCGTGTSAKLGMLYHYDKLKKGEKYKYASIIESVFEGTILDVVKVGEYNAVIPEIKGSAYITGFNNIVFDKEDPYFNGFKI